MWCNEMYKNCARVYFLRKMCIFYTNGTILSCMSWHNGRHGMLIIYAVRVAVDLIYDVSSWQA